MAIWAGLVMLMAKGYFGAWFLLTMGTTLGLANVVILAPAGLGSESTLILDAGVRVTELVLLVIIRFSLDSPTDPL
jgi:hypothetical protein